MPVIHHKLILKFSYGTRKFLIFFSEAHGDVVRDHFLDNAVYFLDAGLEFMGLKASIIGDPKKIKQLDF